MENSILKIWQSGRWLFFVSLFIAASLWGCKEGTTPQHTSPQDAAINEKMEQKTIDGRGINMVITNDTTGQGLYPMLKGEDGKIKSREELSNAEKKEYERIQTEFTKISTKISDAFFQVQELKKLDRAIKRALQAIKNNHIRHQLEQVAAAQMVSEILASSKNLNNEQLSMLGYYTDMLLRNKHQDASVLYPALLTLRDYWADQRIKKAMQQTLKLSRDYLAEKSKGNHALPEGAKTSGVISAKTQKINAIQKASNSLDSMLAQK